TSPNGSPRWVSIRSSARSHRRSKSAFAPAPTAPIGARVVISSLLSVDGVVILSVAAFSLSSDSSLFGDHGFVIFAWHHQRAVADDIEAVDQTVDVGFECFVCLRIGCREGFENRTVVCAEKIDPVLGRFVAKDERLALRRDRGL